MRFGSFLKKHVQDFPPVYFVLVMATGIVSVACHLLQYNSISNFLFYLNHVNYGLLAVMLLIRTFAYPQRMLTNLTDGSTGPGFLSFVAGSCVLGVQYCLIKQVFGPAIVLCSVAALSWLFIIYAFLLITITKPYKASLEQGLNGGWLLLTVSTQSLSILGTNLSAHLAMPADLTLFFTMAGYLLGLFFYLMLISIVFFRLVFDPMKPQEFTPPYWVLMGAAAISALSGATLVQTLVKTGLYSDYIPFIKATSVMTWVIATWWIPLLLLLEIWRHFYKKMPFIYQAVNWDTVFTLGMYTVCTFQIAKVLQVGFLQIVPQWFIYIALIAWLFTFLSMAKSLLKNIGVDLN